MQHCKKVDTDLKSHEAAEALPGEFRPLTATDTHRDSIQSLTWTLTI